MSKEKFVIGIDVGTGSARAALVTITGKVLRSHVRHTKTWNPQPDHYEQSSDDIWQAVCECVRVVIEGHRSEQIVGIGIDATCSLVVLDLDAKPLTISTSGSHSQNIMLWMDHRAAAQADHINRTGHRLLDNFGGKISPETQTPKMLWIKQHLPDTWSRVGHFFDLPDFLAYKCTGNSDVRSLCSAVAKFNYDPESACWSSEFFRQIDLAEAHGRTIGTVILPPGTPIPNGLSARAAVELNLLAGIPIAASLVDAYAGGLSLFGCKASNVSTDFRTKMALICGTSTCHMSMYDRSVCVPGAWGPFKDVLFTGHYVHAAGQSCTGILLDHILDTHPAHKELLALAGPDVHAYDYLNALLPTIAQRRGVQSFHELTANLHVWPDYHGNRSPLADPSMRGMICGLSMSVDVESLAIFYCAFMQALAYGTRHIMDAMRSHGRPEFESLTICGGLSKNSVFVQTCADACGLPIVRPDESEMVLVGAAILGAHAAECYATLEDAAKCMAGRGTVIYPRKEFEAYHRKKYEVFLKMRDDQLAYRSIMQPTSS